MPKKTKPKPTNIMVVLDRSGSMSSVREDTIGGFNTFIEEQRKLGGKCWLSMIQFDNEHLLVHDDVPIADVPPLTEETYIPRATTALLDAIAQGAGRLAERVAGTKRLAHLVILTDGMENASTEVTADQVFEMIEARRKEGWAIQYIGAGQDAIAVGDSLGVARGMSANYAGSGKTTREAFGATSRAAASYRLSGMAGEAVFTSSERSAMMSGGSDLVDSAEAAAELGVSKSTLSRMERSGVGPVPVRPSGKARGHKKYRRVDLREWLGRGGGGS